MIYQIYAALTYGMLFTKKHITQKNYIYLPMIYIHFPPKKTKYVDKIKINKIDTLPAYHHIKKYFYFRFVV